MLVTIRVPDDAIRVQYAIDRDGYETWQTITLGDIINVQTESRDRTTEEDEP